MINVIRTFLLILIIIGVGLIFSRDYWVPTVVDSILASTGQAMPVSYVCANNKTLVANYFPGIKITMLDTTRASGLPPIPTGVVSIRLSDGRSMSLGQTLSADGVRYANPEESFIFWDKGNHVLILEDGKEKDYKNCVAIYKLH